MSRWLQVDCRDLKWSTATRRLAEARRKAMAGDLIEIIATLRSTEEHVKEWCKRTGDRLVRAERDNQVFIVHVQVAGRKLGR